MENLSLRGRMAVNAMTMMEGGLQMLEKEDYLEPNCALCGMPGEEQPVMPVPIGRILEIIRADEDRNDWPAVERHLTYWLAEARMNRDERGELMLRNELMGYYRKQGKKEEACAHSNAALALVEKLGMENTVTAGTTWINSGTVRVAFGESAEGIGFFEKAKENYERNLPESDGRLGGLYNNMGLALTACGRYEEAEKLFQRALSVMAKQENGELEQAVTWLNLADLAEAKLGQEAAEGEIERCLEHAENLLNTESLPRDGYYAYVCEKSAPVFGRYGWFMTEKELNGSAKEINERT